MGDLILKDDIIDYVNKPLYSNLVVNSTTNRKSTEVEENKNNLPFTTTDIINIITPLM